ncbi:hypothetical protein D9615_005483 [Tricholomella constricta]|uniref:GH16 domain-containing protein n=1 Tax=Tricholomella constricta TaxID=117010 RepID=A0A8H5HDQ3_9AGAR|nr:hypothetical protein D9615_005483 [Tricholomella constricta]
MPSEPYGSLSEPLAPPRPSPAPPRPSSARTPPSAFPFQAYPGNPDPLPYSYSRRRSSLESLANGIPAYAYSSYVYPDQPAVIPRSGSLSDFHKPVNSEPVPVAAPPLPIFRPPFLSPASRPSSSLWSWTPPDPTSSSPALPLSNSRSNLQLHRPPLPSTLLIRDDADKNNSTRGDDEKASVGDDTPTQRRATTLPRDRAAWWLTFACLLLGAAGSALLCWTGIRDVKTGMLDESKLCLVLDEDFSSGALNKNVWQKEVEAGGFGNGEFQLTTASDRNIYFKNGQLYIMPTLTRNVVPDFDKDGKTYELEGCTATVPRAPAPPVPSSNSTGHGNGNGNGTTTGSHGNGHRNTTTTTNENANGKRAPAPANSTSAATGNACRAVTDYARGSVINPVMSGRISTKGKVGIKYGRVEVKAKIGRGDWLWPAVWMLPENNTYGAWPLSGEIDILEARGNAPSYPAQGVNYVRSSVNFGLDDSLVPITVPGGAQPAPLKKQLYGWYALKRTAFDKAFHTYTVEWDKNFIRFWVDSRVRSVLDIRVPAGTGDKGKQTKGGNGKGSFWHRGDFPATAQNATTGGVVVVQNPWEAGSAAAPFDQRFYLIIDLAVGGTSGWFPDKLGDKPWYDGSATAMRDFTRAQDKWYQTWPEHPDDRLVL